MNDGASAIIQRPLENPATTRQDRPAMDPAHDESQLERLTFFSDAVFAIAMTLLVIEVRLPAIDSFSDRGLGRGLLELYPHYIGFVSSFLVIGRFWISHHQLFGLLDGTSDRLLWANLFFLFAIAFMPFPTAILSVYVQLRVGVGFYTFWLTLVGVLNVFLIRAALADRSLVKPGIAIDVERRRRRGGWVPVLLGALAFAAGMISPVWALVALAFGGPLIGYLLRRERKAG